VHQLAGYFGFMPGCVPVGCDNRVGLSLISDLISAARTKQIDVVYHPADAIRRDSDTAELRRRVYKAASSYSI
jgi:hypothetical protein